MILTRLLHGCLAGALVVCLGCGGGVAKPRTVPVEGKVTLEGAPLEGVTVTFNPTTSGRHMAHGLTGKDGSFRLSTHNTGDGAAPGTYKIVVVKQAVAAANPGASDATQMGPDYVNAMKANMATKGGKPAKPKGGASEVHQNYRDVNRTPLQATIPDDGKKDVVVPLKKDGT